MPYIGKQPLTGAYQLCDTITTSATATYNLLVGGSAVIPGSANNCIVSLNGVVQAPVGAFTVSGSQITFASTLSATDVIDFILILGNVFDIGTPTNGSVGTSQLATNLTVTHALGAVGTPSITFNGDTNTGIYSPTADTIAFTEGGTEAMRIDSSGQVGIGTSSPLAQLSVQTTAGSNTGFLRFNDITYGGQIRFGKNEGISNDAVLGTWGANNTLFFTDSTERMRIPSGGGLAIGTTSVGTAFMRVSNTSATGRMLEIVQESTSTTTDGSVYSYMGKSSGTDFVHYTAQSLSQVVFKVFGNGNVQNLNNSYGSLSDIKIKKDIIDAGSQWNDIKNVRVRKFRLKDDPTQFFQIGVVAQELEEVSPNLIDEIQDYEKVEVPVLDDNGNPVLNEDGTPQVKEERIPLDTITKSVKYSVLYMKAVKALQEAMERIEQLETKNTNLEARLTALENN